ncbi:riboflavin biosynthesis protein [Alicyclobacillus cellulosilyticus]|uniref:Riboflavin biosynthesis protein n=1 Tax=Alicyclobacillus cellulosilyticus TaxID=1003997 RepID=A0A917NKK1_9BACL|nr:riboflavin biosynthesis protein RibF [Alicyclobacillus cellulosilyticus]GGJ04764.1 riboflavin biosynthesis protein [Alicyclobacillus cellulosilyticus]
MRVIEWTDRPAQEQGALILAIGKFDGVHLGHQAILKRADVLRGRHPGTELGVLTFFPHPDWVLFQRPGYDRWLTPPAEQARLLDGFGVDRLYRVRFTQEYARVSAESFVRQHLSALGVRVVVVGSDFRFGHGGRAGTAELAALGGEMGIEVVVVDPVRLDGEKVGSSRIRALLSAGDVAGAARLLGRPYVLEGTVAAGDALGRKIGFPTANLDGLDLFVLPAFGVYAVTVDVPEHGVAGWPGVMNIGVRPTVGGQSPRAEVHLLDFSGDLYGARMRVSIRQQIRPEQKFTHLTALSAQIQRDVAAARALLASHLWHPRERL